MNNIKNKMRNAFSLLELTICILIVSIIIVVCVPLIMDQMKKTEEYAYFLGFKTVEKLGAQIVAYGDPALAYNNNKLDAENDTGLIAFIGDKLFSKKITPKAYAQRTIILSFPSYEYEMARVCNGNQYVVKDYKDEAGKGFTEEEIAGFNCPGSIHRDQTRMKRRFTCNGTTRDIYSIIAGQDIEAADFCNIVGTDCKNIYSAYNVQYEYKVITLNQAGNRSQYGQCIVYIPENNAAPLTASGNQSNGVFPSYSASTCENFGYYNVIGSYLSGCSCNGMNPERAINHPSICCPTPSTGNVAYADADGNCISGGCKVGAYNEETGTCCPENSYYSRTIGHCACAQGFKPDNAENMTSCQLIEPIVCPTGYHLDAVSNVCVVNPPITKAKRFCELINDNYNVSYSNCNTFNDVKSFEGGIDPISYNQELYNAITAGGKPYLSAQAVQGAFDNIKPNITFSNGLKLWIMGDKVASIAGLSFNPTDYTPDINACVDRKVYTKAECNAAGDTNYFCQSGNHCFTVEAGNSAAKLADARSCCPTRNYEDLQKIYAGNTYLREPRVYAIDGFTVFVDITGEKDTGQGGGTLWKDVFPFYVSSNGLVYAGYPLNASKADISLYQGGNSSALSSDVYYFDIVDGVRRKQVIYSSIPYARAQCFALQVSAFTPYCQNLGTKFKGGQKYDKIDKYIYSNDNPCWKHRCYVHVKNKIKFL